MAACAAPDGTGPVSGTQTGATNANEPAGATELAYNALTGEALPEGVAAGQRPVGIMMNNAQAALPQRGIGAADAVVEMLSAEGGVTRVLALYNNLAGLPQVGPVSSARDQHVQLALPINAMLVHIGTSVYAENLLNQYTYQSIDGRYLGTQVFQFDSTRAGSYPEENCWYTDTTLVTAGTTLRAMPGTGAGYPLLQFAQEGEKALTPEEGDAPDTRFQFSDAGVVQFTFDAAGGLYRKMAYGQPHLDESTGEQLAYRNVFVLFAETGLKPDGYCVDYNLSSGTGYYLYNGKYQKIQWAKGAPEQPLRIFTVDGKEVKVNTGKTYIGFVPVACESSFVADVNAPLPEAATSEGAPASGTTSTATPAA